jgi:ElaB/YqjD/DUF883 family membrane-anchored ribosome-binding protein
MPPQNELPEGTDHIINGAMETGGGSGGAGASGAAGAGAGAGAGGGSAIGGGSLSGGGGSGGGGDTGGVVEQLRGQAYQLRDQGVDRVRDFAVGGKVRASDALEELSRVLADTGDTIDERLGREYGEYARRAADSVSGFADTLRSKEVDEIYDNVRDAVRKSPGVAIGVAAVVGFALARVVKAGLAADDATASGGGGTIGSGTRSDDGGGGTIGSGTRTGGGTAGGTGA